MLSQALARGSAIEAKRRLKTWSSRRTQGASSSPKLDKCLVEMVT